ncbi:hypothetical protein GGI25_002231 [Coemansia spiralis]|uniref:Uncharacterized protein n=2 Tax=Coemansia TaxID=4863 RepID=A0A9W8GB66_9FUNG|nr:hypothetical protein EDC05_000131 [Coemansia umbellata]KAJ2626003.1 hypothetical protein GGI26_000087 [Coemansia sp. RSA 1358]KAJ2678643.1 hypothetical protein GGI25_002231 [Coemansia spiralis]
MSELVHSAESTPLVRHQPEEQAAMERELQWLLHQNIPQSITDVHTELASVSFLSSKSGSTRQTPTQIDLVSAGRHPESKAMGTATIVGTLVTQLSLEITISSQLNQGKPTTIYLKKNESLALRQAQDAQSYVRSAQRKARDIPRFCSSSEALCHVESVLNDIMGAKRMLAADDQHDLMPLQSENTEKFAPALPENLVIECNLKGDTFFAHVYWLKFRHSFKSTGILDAFKRDQSTGHMLVFNGRPAEVRRELLFQARVHDVQRDIEVLDRAAGLCIDVVGQLHAFDSM